MSVVRSANVISANANADTIEGPLCIESIRVSAGAGGITLALKKKDNSGSTLFECILGANAQETSETPLYVPQAGLYVAITAGSGTIYLYSE
jgi:hypothetical protein